MITISKSELKKLNERTHSLDNEWQDWQPHQQEIARFLLPRRYIYNMNNVAGVDSSSGGLQVVDRRGRGRKNEYILDPVGTEAARVLAAGLMNGITSPARPWFMLRFSDFNIEQTDIAGQQWLQEVIRRMLIVFSESNFYNAMAVNYLDLATFATSALLIYEDFDDVVRFYVSPNGEYRLAQDHRREVDTFFRTIMMTSRQLVERFGLENCSEQVQTWYKNNAAQLNQPQAIAHLIEPNRPDALGIAKRWKFREVYWERREQGGKLLSLQGFNERPLVAPRWETTANDTYGTGPAHDALPEIIQLQHMTRRHAQALDKMVSPPIVADISLQSQPNALFPGGVSYVPFASQTVGAKPIYTINPPLQDMMQNIQTLHERIRRIFYNHLFQGITDLDTVRSALEIQERTNEKLVLLGPTLERFNREALDPIIRRTFAIMDRKGLIPELPDQYKDQKLEIQYVSIMSNAQKAANTAATERFMAFVGNLAGAKPEVLDIPNFDELVRDYGDKLGMPAKSINPRDMVAQMREARQTNEQMANAAAISSEVTGAAKNLSETEVGAGQNALQRILG